MQACIPAVTQNADPSTQVQLCQQAADDAEALGPNQHFIERRMAFVYASTAYTNSKQSERALAYADRAIAVAQEKDTESGSGLAGAYFNRAKVEVAFHELQKASDDLARTEDLARDVLTRMAASAFPAARQPYAQWVKGVFTYHAQVLSAEGKPDEAAAKTAEGAKL